MLLLSVTQSMMQSSWSQCPQAHWSYSTPVPNSTSSLNVWQHTQHLLESSVSTQTRFVTKTFVHSCRLRWVGWTLPEECVPVDIWASVVALFMLLWLLCCSFLLFTLLFLAPSFHVFFLFSFSSSSSLFFFSFSFSNARHSALVRTLAPVTARVSTDAADTFTLTIILGNCKYERAYFLLIHVSMELQKHRQSTEK